MRSLLCTLTLALAACGGEAHTPRLPPSPSPATRSDEPQPEPSPMEEADPEPPSPGDEPDVSPTPASDPEECEDNGCAGCPWCDEQPDVPPVVDPPLEPEPPPPTPEEPAVYECIPGDDCERCESELDPALAATGAQLCLVRECSVEADCEGLGDGLVCRQRPDPGGPQGRLHCRLPLPEEGEQCLIDEATAPAPEAQCESGLWCRERAVGGLRCVPFEG
jgi:hypothetical protein